MPFTDKMRDNVYTVKDTLKAMKYLQQNERYNAFKDADKGALRQYIKENLNVLRKTFVNNPQVQQNYMFKTSNALNLIQTNIHESSMTIDENTAVTVASALLSRSEDAITDEVADAFIDNPECFGAVNEAFFDILPDSYDEIDSELSKIQEPNFSSSVNTYVKTGDSEFDIIKNLRTQEQLNELKDEVDAAKRLKDQNSFFEKDYNTKVRDYETKKTVASAVDRDAKTVEKMLEGLTPADGNAYTDRLEEIVTYVVNSNGTDPDSRLTFVGTNPDSIKLYSGAVQYVQELFTRSNALSNRKTEFTAQVSFDKIVQLAYERNYTQNSNERIASVKNKLNNIIRVSKTNEFDSTVIGNYFKNCETSEEIEQAYAKALSDMVGNKMDITGTGGVPFTETQSDIARANEYLLRNARESGVSIELISPERIKKTCDRLLNAELNAADMMRDFNNALNRYEVTGKELVELTFGTHPNSPEYLSAQVKTQGLNRQTSPELLDDAIGVWARLKEVHEHRTFWQKFFHPFRNRAENNAIEKMEQTLKRDFGMTDETLSAAKDRVLDLANDPISKEARKRDDMDKAVTADIEAKKRKNERDKIIQVKLDNIQKYGSIEAPAPVEKKAENKPVAEEKKPVKKEEAPEEDKNDLYRLQKLSDAKFNRYLKRASAEERKELEDKYSSHGKKQIDEETRNKIDMKVKQYENELIQLHVDPDGYINDYNSQIIDRDKDSMEKAVIEAMDNKNTRNRLKKEHEINQKIREHKKEVYVQREELRLEYHKLGDIESRYGLNDVNVNAENKSREKLMADLTKFHNELKDDLNKGSKEQPAKEELIIEENSKVKEEIKIDEKVN